ncbi:MAG: tyrosine-type recombinase/integrase [Candidatus Hydrogenedentes bacterium]|nr:tyrosine-type recombinase/integrase [Candidatus Hydrogenedentota bacterium]
MLETLIKARHVLAWHQGTLFGPYLDGFVEALAAQDFNQHSICQRVCAVTWFAEYLRPRGVHVISDITESHVRDFASAQGKERGIYCIPQRRKAVKDMLAYLERRGAWTRPPKPEATGPVADFLRALATERGLVCRSIEPYRRYLSHFLEHAQCDGTREGLAKLTADDLDGFILKMGRCYGRRTMGCICVCIRGLLRYLYREGILASDLSAMAPRPRYYAFERLPCALPWETVQRILDVVDTTRPRGRRDYAMLKLLVTYGLRAGEINKLQLQDIDWRRDLIHVRRSKAGRPLTLPLSRDVGEAVLAYLRKGRPKTKCRELFVRVQAPHTALRIATGGMVTLYMRKAGIESVRTGAHVIRHSFAVHLLRQGKPLKTITDLLGHRDPFTAYHYTKLALEDLHDVALPVTEVMP